MVMNEKTQTQTESLCHKCNRAFKKGHDCPEIIEWVRIKPWRWGV